jgi:hypothetical protein
MSKRKQMKLGREKLQSIIELCKSIEEHSLDPFLVKISDVLPTLREYFPELKLPEDLCLDAETIHNLASVVKIQNEWVKHRSTSLYTDPFLLEEKLSNTPKEEIIQVFLKAWNPIVELEKISIYSLKEALQYWDSLLPLKDRWNIFYPFENETNTATREELMLERIFGEVFSEKLENFWVELKNLSNKNGENGKIEYWDFIGAETYGETVRRAFLASFLVTYGYATLELVPLEEKIFIKPYLSQVTKIQKNQLVSIPITVTATDWKKWKKGELD